jgi:hypothetical protein
MLLSKLLESGQGFNLQICSWLVCCQENYVNPGLFEVLLKSKELAQKTVFGFSCDQTQSIFSESSLDDCADV